MGNIAFDLPHDLGTLDFNVPSPWVGGRPEGATAAWLGSEPRGGILDNVVLNVRSYPLQPDAEALLDKFVEKMLETLSSQPTEAVISAPGRRLFNVRYEKDGKIIQQEILLLYAANPEQSFVTTLTSTRGDVEPVVGVSDATIVAD